MIEFAEHLLFLNLVAVEPLFGVRRIRRLERQVALGDGEARLVFYTWAIVGNWAFATAVLTLWIAAGRSATSLGLAAFPDGPFVVASTGAALLTLFLLSQIRAARSMTSEDALKLRHRLSALETVVPHSAGERSVFGGVSITAGFCEELLYRGFMMAYLAPWLGWWQAGVASSISFGLGHAYQGAAGVLKTTVVGLVMGGLYLYSGSLWPAIVLHMAIDLQSGGVAHEVLRRTAEG
jgi:membrane protease YdiL (CAAX protease family)